MKIIVLIISSSTPFTKLYNDLKNLQSKVFEKLGIEYYFLECDPTIEQDLVVSNNTITAKAKESYTPGILIKTLKALDFIHKNKTYDLVLRTNLSSLFNYPKLIEHLDKTIKNKQENFCGGVLGKVDGKIYLSGAGILLGKNAVDHLVSGLFDDALYNYPDDVAISQMLKDDFTFTALNRLDIIRTQGNEYNGAFYLSKIELLLDQNPLCKYLKMARDDIGYLDNTISIGFGFNDTLSESDILHPLFNEIYHFRIKNENDRDVWDIFWYERLCRLIYGIDLVTKSQ